MKKLFIFTFIAILFYSGECLASYVAIMKDKANVRSGPGKDFEIIMTLDNAIYYPLKVIKQKGKWVQVKDYEGDSGWIADFLTKKIKAGIVKKKANVRSKAGKDGKKLWEAKKGETFKILKEEKKWVEVIDIVGNKGWIYKSLLWGF